MKGGERSQKTTICIPKQADEHVFQSFKQDHLPLVKHKGLSGLPHHCYLKFYTDWLKVTFQGETETAVRLGIKSWFADMGLSTSDCIWGLLFLLLTECP